MKEYLYKVKGFGGFGRGDGLHAADCCNVVFEKDAMHKRHGYARLATMGGAVRSMHRVRLAGDYWLLVYSGCRFYVGRAVKDLHLVDITLSASVSVVDVGRLLDRRIQVFVRNDKAYIVGCGDYLVLGYWDGTMQLRRVEDAPDTYIPTTCVGIGCKDNATYVPIAVDDATVGDYYYRQGEEYVAVTFDADQNLPLSGVDYYRKVVYPDGGQALDQPNMLSSYRINTLYGTPADNAVYMLDAGKVDSDSQTVVRVVTGEQGDEVYTLRPVLGAEVVRAPVVGDDLGGRTLQFAEQTVGGVGSLHLLPTNVGFSVLQATGGRIAWHAGGITASAWNSAYLAVEYRDYYQVVAVATRANWLSAYTVYWTGCTITLPDGFGIVQSITPVQNTFPCTGTLPTLRSDLACGDVVWGSLDYRTGTLQFVRPTTPKGLQDNITVTYKARQSDFCADLIGQATVGFAYGVGGNADRLFVGGGAQCPFADYYSQSDDWTYFAPISYTRLGQNGRIVGYMRRGQNLITMLTDCEAPNAYVRVGSWQQVDIKVGTAQYAMRTASFAVSQVFALPMAVADGAFATLGDDNLYLAADGLYSVYSTNLSDEKRTMCRSAPLIDRVWDAEAVAIAHEGRYYVSDGRNVYVGDSRYRYNLYGSANYEWVRWDIAEVTAWATIEGALAMGKADGSVCVFGQDYNDVLRWDVAAGQLALNLPDNRLHYAPDLPVVAGDVLVINTPAYIDYVEAFEVEGACVYVDADAILGVYEGTQLYAVVNNAIVGPYTVGDVDWGKCCFVLCGDNAPPVWDAAPTALLQRVDGRRLVVVDVTRDSFALALHADAAAVAWYAASAPITATVLRSTPVQAHYTSEILSVGASAAGKMLTGVSVGGAVGSDGIHFAVRTSDQSRVGAIGGQAQLAMDWLRFDAFAFDGDFHRVYRARIKLRFHYLQWQLNNADGADLTVDSVYLHYRYCHSTKEGVEE